MTAGSDDLVIQAEMPALATVAAWAETVSARLNLPASTSFAVQLCCEEAVSNIVRYGFAPETATDLTQREVHLSLAHRDQLLVMTIEDFGRPFDPLLVAAPPAVATVEDAVVGGQGIHLMRQFATRLAYERAAQTNRLSLFFDLPNDGP